MEIVILILLLYFWVNYLTSGLETKELVVRPLVFLFICLPGLGQIIAFSILYENWNNLPKFRIKGKENPRC